MAYAFSACAYTSFEHEMKQSNPLSTNCKSSNERNECPGYVYGILQAIPSAPPTWTTPFAPQVGTLFKNI
eukprot:m.269593 g.269593  ORF g.269593 m.269593 type:complete len:70 (-) comp15674_c0_seq12:1666-1875(-)